MNKKFNVGVYVFASVLGFVAGGLFTKTHFINDDADENDKLYEEIDIFGEES